MKVRKKVVVIGGGFAGLSAASYLAQGGLDVTLIEKNDSLGGRCRSFEAKGFVFDMGPSWYWMPDVFEKFYSDFGHEASDFYKLVRLDPSYKVVFEDDQIDLSANYQQLKQQLEQYQPGVGEHLDKFLKDAKYKYEVGMGEYVQKPSLSITEFFRWKILNSFLKMDLFSSISSEIRSKFKNPKLVQLLEFPVLFLGAKPQNTPALYSLMNYADIMLGTWYPMGGMAEIPRAMETIAREQGVKIVLNSPVDSFEFTGSKINKVITKSATYIVDHVISTADYHHTETHLLPAKYRSYNDKYWESRTMAPSSLLFYLGIDKKVEGLQHHNLFFDTDFGKHASEIYDTPDWPENPLFYVCCPSKTDPSVAPLDGENIFVLIPLAAGLHDNEEERENIFSLVLERLQNKIGQDLSHNIIYKRSFCVNDFKSEYNSFKGNAYGLANTLMQTAFLKPKMKSKKVDNLLYAGQLTTPGPGVPPSLISGEVAANYLMNRYN
ncbi:UNVERIFIED_CONTAM: hypothetical protein GTU68_056551 [Idotea baltica]|nr:hypothetical protein [Idotea baltica]